MDNEYMSITSESVPNIETLENNAELFIYGYFADIKRKVDLRREDLIERIHNYSDEIIQSIERTQSECLKMSKEVNQLTVEVEKSKRNLNELIKSFNTDERKRESIDVLNKSYTKVLNEYNDALLGFNKYWFDFNEIDIKDVFGYFCKNEMFDSTIMDIGLKRQLVNLCEFPFGQKWVLKYRASRDGFRSIDFHSKCDGIANTLTIIKAKTGNIFGGFTEQKWSSDDEDVTDPNAFIFSLVNKEEKPFKALCSNEGECALHCHEDVGPCFGLQDIIICSESNKLGLSVCEFGYTYQHPDYVQDTDKAVNILAGLPEFKTLEIEVFVKQLETLTA